MPATEVNMPRLRALLYLPFKFRKLLFHAESNQIGRPLHLDNGTKN